MHWFPHVINNPTLDNLVGNWIPCGTLVIGVAGVYRHWVCNEPKCLRHGHPHGEHGRPVCSKHYNSDNVDPR